MRRVKWTGRTLAHQCAWCLKPASPEDAEAILLGAKVSHGICDDCQTRHLAAIAEAERHEEAV